MTTFNDGPAKGAGLMLKRNPFFLRVVQQGDKFDALDKPEDVAKPTEKLYGYRLASKPGWCHINASHGRGGFFPIAQYQILDPQPTEEQMRDKTKWAGWCAAQSWARKIRSEWGGQ